MNSKQKIPIFFGMILILVFSSVPVFTQSIPPVGLPTPFPLPIDTPGPTPIMVHLPPDCTGVNIVQFTGAGMVGNSTIVSIIENELGDFHEITRHIRDGVFVPDEMVSGNTYTRYPLSRHHIWQHI